MNITENIKNIAILGSTGSIGTQTLDIISHFPERFKAGVLTANHNWELLVKQALIYKPEIVVIADENYYQATKEALTSSGIKVLTGSQAIADVVSIPSIDLVVTAMVGYSGLLPTFNAISSGKNIALANKETLVVAGELITQLAQKHKVKIIPVDSEHSAIFQ